MAVYIVTGKLGSGKTLVTVGKIRDALQEGKPVATNLNIRLEKMVGRKAKTPRLYRLPDRPTSDDLNSLGSGNDTYDEDQNGLIVLDECGTWFNARNWQDKGRKQLLEWLLHARKLGWDIMFIVQDISMIDKQAKVSVAEHVVYCRRLDRLGIPLIDPFAKLFRKKGVPKPKIHLAIVKYGYEQHALTVDRWFYTGKDLYPCYDTKQGFRDDYPHSMYLQLPPYYTHGRYSVPLNLRNIMRLTKIHFRRFSKVGLLAFGIFGGAAIAGYIQKPEPVPIVPLESSAPVSQVQPVIKVSEKSESKKDIPLTVAEKFNGFILDGVAANSSGEVIYASVANGEDRFNIHGLRSSGYVVRMVSKCEVLIMNKDRSQNTRLYTTYCGPDKPPSELPSMTKQERYQWKLQQVRAQERLNRS